MPSPYTPRFSFSLPISSNMVSLTPGVDGPFVSKLWYQTFDVKLYAPPFLYLVLVQLIDQRSSSVSLSFIEDTLPPPPPSLFVFMRTYLECGNIPPVNFNSIQDGWTWLNRKSSRGPPPNTNSPPTTTHASLSVVCKAHYHSCVVSSVFILFLNTL